MGVESYPPVLFIMGPTASAKTALAASLYDELACELISVDAVQVYRGMDIGTAKPDDEFLKRYPHHLINILEPIEGYNAAKFCHDARKLIAEIHQRNRLPVFVGGTMFYFSALENGLAPLPASSAEIRDAIAREIARQGLNSVYQQLLAIDSVFARSIHPTDRQRIARAMEIFRQTGETPSHWLRGDSANSSAPGKIRHPIIKLALFLSDRKDLHEAINRRFRGMIKSGLVDEVREVFKGISDVDMLPAARSVGYRQVLDYLSGKSTYEQMMAKGIAATRQLAKRQLTWLRNQSGVVWCRGGDNLDRRTICSFVQRYRIVCG